MNIGKIEWTKKTYLYNNIYIYNVHVRYQQHSFLPMFEIEMVLAFSKLSHQKEIQPRKKKVPCSSSGFQSYLKGKENHVKCDSSWNGTNLKRFNMKCESSWKGQFLNKNHIKCESSWKGKLLKRNHIKYDGSWKGQIWKKHSKCESSWQGNFLKRTGIEYNRSWKGQIWKDFITSNVKVPELEHFWKEIASYMIVLGKGKKSLRHAMSICRYVDMSMWFDVVTATVRNLRRLVGILFTAIFSPFCDTERNAIWTPEFIVVHHSSSRIQELSPDIHVPCYGHTGHTHYVSFFTGPSWWRYWETSRILCMMLSTLKNRTVIGDHDPILLEKTHLFATTTYYAY